MNKLNNLSLEDTEYILNLPYHLERANMTDDLCILLKDFEFIEHKIFASTVEELSQDYDLALASKSQISDQKKIF